MSKVLFYIYLSGMLYTAVRIALSFDLIKTNLEAAKLLETRSKTYIAFMLIFICTVWPLFWIQKNEKL